jgi:hypothetical protein
LAAAEIVHVPSEAAPVPVLVLDPLGIVNEHEHGMQPEGLLQPQPVQLWAW